MAGPRRGLPPTTMEMIPDPPDESCQATAVSPVVSDERSIQRVSLQRNDPNKSKRIVEKKESPKASSRFMNRRKREFCEVKRGRSFDMDIHAREISNLTISPGARRRSRGLNAQNNICQGWLDVKTESSTPTGQTDSDSVATECDLHRCDITGDDAEATKRPVTDAPVIDRCHIEVSTEQGDCRHNVSVPVCSSDEHRGDVATDCENLRMLNDFTCPTSDNRGTVRARTGKRRRCKKNRNRDKGCERRVYTEVIDSPTSDNGGNTRPKTTDRRHSKTNKTSGTKRVVSASTSAFYRKNETESLTCTNIVNARPITSNSRHGKRNSNRITISSSSDVRRAWNQKTYKGVHGQNAECTPATPRSDRFSIKERPVMQRGTPRRKTDLRKVSILERQLIRPVLGNNVCEHSPQHIDISKYKMKMSSVGSLRHAQHSPGVKGGHKKPNPRLTPQSVTGPRRPSELSSSETYGYKARGDDRGVLREKYSLPTFRLNYLTGSTEYQELGFQIVYLDDAWMNNNHSTYYMWRWYMQQGPDIASGKGHPLLSQRSLMRLSSLLTMEVCQMVMIDLGMSTDRIANIRREANKKYMSEGFLLLLTWCQRVRGTKDDTDVIKDIESALQNIGRTDLAGKIAKARKDKREIDNQDEDDKI